MCSQLGHATLLPILFMNMHYALQEFKELFLVPIPGPLDHLCRLGKNGVKKNNYNGFYQVFFMMGGACILSVIFLVWILLQGSSTKLFFNRIIGKEEPMFRFTTCTSQPSFSSQPQQVRCASNCFPIEKAGRPDFMHKIARHLINKEIKNR